MSANKEEYSNIGITLSVILPVIFILGINIYYYGIPLFYKAGIYSPFLAPIFNRLRVSGMFDTPYITKGIAALLGCLLCALRTGKKAKMQWREILYILIGGTVIYFLPTQRIVPVYILFTIVGYVMMITGVGLAVRKGKPDEDQLKKLNDDEETFQQCDELMENEYSVNIPTKYKYKGVVHNGWANVVIPQRSTLIIGSPGSGKSFCIFNPFIQQMIEKSYTMFLYDYKYPDLTERVYNEYLRNKDNYMKNLGVVPKFYVINFNDPRCSHRCNPINPKYITESSDTAEIAEVIFRNMNKGVQDGGGNKFFSDSAKRYIDILINFLSLYKGGRYCTFPHVIELMAADYKKVFEILKDYPELEAKMSPFANALESNVMEQLQGQIASAQIPMNIFSSPKLYWTLSGDDFTLDINNPKEPKIVCVGNDPDRQAIYGTTLALFTSRIFANINHKGRTKCAVILDELPTIFLQGIDNLINTSRSNDVCIVAGCQDKSQLRRDYGDKDANVIFNTVGNVFCGQVNGETAKDMSTMLGKQFREEKSFSESESESTSTSFREHELIPSSRIEALSQGTFVGKVADTYKQKIKKKMFCGEIQVDMEHNRALEQDWHSIEELKDEYTGEGEERRKVICDFGEKEIIEKIDKNKAAYLFEHYKLELIAEWERKKDGEDVYYNDDAIAQQAQEQIDSLNEEEKELKIEDIKKAECKKAMDRIIKENYNQIKADVKKLVEDEYKRVKAKEKAKEEETNDPDKRAQKYIADRNKDMNKKANTMDSVIQNMNNRTTESLKDKN